MSNFVIPLAFPYSPNDVGGLKSAMEVGVSNDKFVTLVAPDSSVHSSGNMTVIPAAELRAGEPDRWEYWFGTGSCQVAFPEAFTNLAATPEALEAMYREFPDYNRPKNSPAWLAEHIDQNANMLADAAFASRFADPIRTLVEHAPTLGKELVMAYQSFFFTPVITANNKFLRDAGIPQTWHWHESIPENLAATKIGRSMLSAMSLVDVVFVHTDQFATRLLKQFAETFPDRQLPCVRRFDLGTDVNKTAAALRRFTKFDPLTTPGYSTLDENQKKLIAEIYCTKNNPNITSFICIDRIDPVKGNDVTIKAIRKFLEETGESVESLNKKFRFYFINNAFNADGDISMHASLRYSNYCNALLEDLIKDFPGIIGRSGPLKDPTREILPCLIQGSTLFTGGTTEGLSLVTAEAAVSNQVSPKPVGVISGKGCGMAMRLEECGLQDTAFLTTPGSVEQFVAAFREVAHLRNRDPQLLQDKMTRLARFIAARKTSLVYDRFEIQDIINS